MPHGRCPSAATGPAGLPGEVRVWRKEGKIMHWIWQAHFDSVRALAFSPDSRSLLSGSDDDTLRVWDVERGQCVHIIQSCAISLYDLDWSPDGTRLASAGSDLLVTIWELESGEHLRTLRRGRPYERLDVSGVQGLTDAQRATLRALGAIEKKGGLLKE